MSTITNDFLVIGRAVIGEECAFEASCGFPVTNAMSVQKGADCGEQVSGG